MRIKIPRHGGNALEGRKVTLHPENKDFVEDVPQTQGLPFVQRAT
jgi:hypothetical protein